MGPVAADWLGYKEIQPPLRASCDPGWCAMKTKLEQSVSLIDLDRVLAAVGRHWQDACEHGDLDAAKRDMQRLDAYLEQRLRLMTQSDD